MTFAGGPRACVYVFLILLPRTLFIELSSGYRLAELIVSTWEPSVTRNIRLPVSLGGRSIGILAHAGIQIHPCEDRDTVEHGTRHLPVSRRGPSDAVLASNRGETGWLEQSDTGLPMPSLRSSCCWGLSSMHTGLPGPDVLTLKRPERS